MISLSVVGVEMYATAIVLAVIWPWTMPNMTIFNIRPMRHQEISLATDWAADEGWNPGFADASCFATVDPEGFLIGELDGEPAAMISCVNYDAAFSFLGFYVVRPELRGRGFGIRVWKAAMQHAGHRTVGLDGVVAQQANYRKSGFKLAWSNFRYGGTAPCDGSERHHGLVALETVSPDLIQADDRTVFPASRARFLKTWINTSGHIGRALLRGGKLEAWGVIRQCRTGHKIGPLVASRRLDAETVLRGLLEASGAKEFFLDVPAINHAAVALAESLGLKPAFETARMYRGQIPSVRVDRIFGVTSFELG